MAQTPPKRGRGRPPIDNPREELLTVRIDARTLAELDGVAKQESRTKGQIVVDGIRWYLKRAANRARLKPKK